MIKKLSDHAEKSILERLIAIHKDCISKTNSQVYNETQIQEWLSTINVQSIVDQLDNTKWVYLEEEGEIIGFAQYSFEDKELYQIQISPLKQGKGFGKKLYQYIEEDFIKNQINEISLYATLNAVPFYKSLGYKTVKDLSFQLIESSVSMTEMKKVLS